jgi:hypothetical protein
VKKTSPSVQTAAPRFRVWHALLLGVAVTGAQLGITVGFQREATLKAAYANLFQWDSEHYDGIAKDGYFSNLPALAEGTELTQRSWVKHTNVAFFPGYPFLARLLRPLMFRKFALLLTAQLAAVGMWTTLVLLLRRLDVKPAIIGVVIVFIAAHPAAFYLVAAYSESLFLWGLFGMLFWTIGRQGRGWLLAGFHGFAMSVTRAFGLSLAVLPFLDALLTHAKDLRTAEAKTALWRGAFASALSAAGALLFFAYCQIAFGLWNLYFLRQSAGWNIHPEYAFPLSGSMLTMLFPAMPDSLQDGQGLSRLATAATFWFLVAGFGLDSWISRRQKIGGFRARLLLWIAAALLFYLPAAALVGNGFQSMLRHTFSSVVLAALALAHLWSRATLSPRTHLLLGAFALLCAAVLFSEQAILLRVFTSGGWVA